GRLWDHIRQHRLAGDRIGHADHCDLGHAGQLLNDVFDFARIHVESRDDDQLADAVDEHQVSAVIDIADVAGGEPTVGTRTVAAIGPKAAEQIGAANPN